LANRLRKLPGETQVDPSWRKLPGETEVDLCFTRQLTQPVRHGTAVHFLEERAMALSRLLDRTGLLPAPSAIGDDGLRFGEPAALAAG
jgi:hypothetical protein